MADNNGNISLKVAMGIFITLIIFVMGVYQWQISQTNNEMKEIRDLLVNHEKQGAHPFQEAQTDEILRRIDRLEDKIDMVTIKLNEDGG